MGLYNIVDRYVLLPIADVLNGSSISKRLKEFERRDFFSSEQLKELQNRKLQKLIAHCYDSVPYYHKLFDKLGIKSSDIKCAEDLVKLPVLTKQIIRDNYDDMFSNAVDHKRFKKCSTGGSTGTPLKFCTDTTEWSGQKAVTLRSWGWYGIHLGDKIFSLGGNSIVAHKNKWSKKNIYDLVIMRNYKHSSADVSDEGMQRHYEAFMKLKPKALRGYGSSLYILARYIEKNNLPVAPVKAVLTTGEVLMPEYRMKLEKVFGAPVYDDYGASDGGILSHECLERDGLHVADDMCVIEIADKDGNVLPDGTTGYVLATDLENFAFPFIRYQVGDMAYFKPGKCKCGRETKVIGEVMGRCGKLMFNKQGVPISPTMLPIMLYPHMDYHNPEYQKLYNKIDRFQIRQDMIGDIAILLKMKDKTDETAQFDYVVENYQKHFQGSAVSLHFVDEIPCLPSGKEDYCVSEYVFNQ